MNTNSTEVSLDRLDLATIGARAEAATPGPWRSMVIDADNATVWAGGNTARTATRIARVTRRVADNAEFIAAAREDVPALVAEVERLRAALRDAAEQVAEADDAVGAAIARAHTAETKLHAVAMVKAWKNEDGKRFVFADELFAAVAGDAR